MLCSQPRTNQEIEAIRFRRHIACLERRLADLRCAPVEAHRDSIAAIEAELGVLKAQARGYKTYSAQYGKGERKSVSRTDLVTK